MSYRTPGRRHDAAFTRCCSPPACWRRHVRGSAAAALYKWTDAQGRIVYSDQPPAANVKTEQLRAPPPPANPNAAKELAQREAEFRKRQAEARRSRAPKADKERADAAKRAEALRAGARPVEAAGREPARDLPLQREGRARGDGRRRARPGAREAQRVHPRQHKCPAPRDARTR